MIRKTFIALAATLALGATALVPTAASAKHVGGGIHSGHGGWGHGWGSGGIYVVSPEYSDCVQWVRVGYRTWRKTYTCG